MIGRRLVASAALALNLVACAGGAPRKPKVELDFAGQNLLLVTIDTLRADRLGSYGYAGAATPRLDELARGGVRFERCWSAVPLTLPSHATMFTGRYPFDLGVRINGVDRLPDSAVTLAELLAERGYHTSAAVAAYVVTAKFGLAQGFDVYDDGLGGESLFRFTSEIRADRVYEKFRRLLAAERSGRFFTWVHFYDPHLPYDPPGELRQRFADDPYSGEIAYVDGYVGRMIDDLRSAGILDRTLVVVTSDHGDGFGEHGERGHGLLAYDETLSVPLLFYAPGRLPAGRVVASRVRLVDLLPTFADLFGFDAPAGQRGASLAPLLAGGEDATPRESYFETLAGFEAKGWAPLTGLVSDHWKLISVPEPELYDLARDPGEKENLYSTERRTAHRLEGELAALVGGAEAGGGAVARAARRELSPEDVRHLKALGYLAPGRGRPTGPRLDPKRGMAIENRQRSIRAMLEAGKADEAAAALEELRAENPDRVAPDLLDLRHDIEAARDHRRAAIAALEEEIERFPDLEGPRFKLAGYYYRLGRDAEVVPICEKLLAANPDLSQALNLLGLVAERRGRLAEARGYFERALAIEPGNAALTRKLADLLAQKGEIPRAVELYDRLLAAGELDGRPDALFKAAIANSVAGRTERAEELFRRGIALRDDGVDHLMFALLLLKEGKHDEARRHLERAAGPLRGDLSAEQVKLVENALASLGKGG